MKQKPASVGSARMYAHKVPSDDELSVIQFLNDSEERRRSPVGQFAKEVVAAVSAILPGSEVFLGAMVNMLDRREASNRNELVQSLIKTTREYSSVLVRLTSESDDHARFFKEEFPGLVVESVRRAETVRSKARIRRFAAILRHSLELGPNDGADFVEEMLRIASELSDWDVRVLDMAAREFAIEKKAKTGEADTVFAARAWLQMKSGVSGDELASIGAKLQSFGLASRLEGHTGDMNSYRVLERGRRFLEYIRAAD